MYDAEYTRKFYNAYGDKEWARLERSPYGRLEAIIHSDFIKRFVKLGDRVLDAGSGPGRFSISMARLGAKVTVLDISDTQLESAREKLAEAKMLDTIDRFIRADITDLSMFGDASFDAVVCFGGALSYVCERRQEAADELIRVTKPGGNILVSVMSNLGAVLGVVKAPDLPYLREPSKRDLDAPGMSSLWETFETGDLPGFPSRAGLMHAPMHMYTAKELEGLFEGCEILRIAGCCVTLSEYLKTPEEIAQEPAWSTVVELERRLSTDPGLVNTGSHIILAARKAK
ncbi:MAG: class I SAM-dependent methyltransferase [Chloroflexi bacterium]|nr:class I SAM-dependent methyltransferase [Chloroflexota bacterium]